MKRLPNKSLIRGVVRSHFRSDCSNCYQVFNCIFARAFSMKADEYVLEARGHRKPVTQAMLEGKRKHEEILSQYKTVDEHGIENIRNDLEGGHEVTLSEVRVCSPKYGIRGVIDLLQITPIFASNSFAEGYIIHAVELKSSFYRPYLWQMVAYARILSDPNFEVIYEVPMKKKKKMKVVGESILPRKDASMSIITELQVIGQKRSFKRDWMVGGKLTRWAEGYNIQMYKKANYLRRFHKYAIYPLQHREQQLYFGKHKILRQTRPVVRL